MKLKYIIVLLSFFCLACGPKKGVVTKKKQSKKTTKEDVTKTSEVNSPSIDKLPGKPKVLKSRPRTSVNDYIHLFAPIAMQEMLSSKIPASITLAQGILESGVGNGRLAKEANNHFGIKCHGWKGKKIYHDDDRSQECFRKYNDASESFKDHSEFLTGRKRYASLFKLRPDDYKAWAKGLRSAGYATDRKYPQKLIGLIERYDLYKYDKIVLGKRTEKTEEKITEAVSHVVVKGDTLYSLSKRYGMTVEELKQKNKLTSNDLAIGQVLLIKSQ